MNFTVYVVEFNSLGPAKFYLFMMAYLTAIIWLSVRSENERVS